jgi:hypothetical protein
LHLGAEDANHDTVAEILDLEPDASKRDGSQQDGGCPRAGFGTEDDLTVDVHSSEAERVDGGWNGALENVAHLDARWQDALRAQRLSVAEVLPTAGGYEGGHEQEQASEEGAQRRNLQDDLNRGIRW